MTGTLLGPLIFRAVDANGVPMNGALLQFYLTGTTTPTPAYTSASLGTPLSNPVASDSAGLFPAIFLDPAVTYRVQLQTAGATVIRDLDPVGGPITIAAGAISAAMLAAGSALANLGFTPVNKAGDTATNLLLTNSALAATSAGYLGAPVNEQDANYTLALADAGKLIRGNSAGGIAWTIPPIASVAFVPGTVILVRNVGAGVVTLTRGAGVTQVLAGSGTSKDVALAQWGYATLTMETNNNWIASGTGLS